MIPSLPLSIIPSLLLRVFPPLFSWYSYEHVWRRDKSSTVTRFCARGPSVKQYDDKLRFYTHLASELSQAPQQVTHGCVRYWRFVSQILL